MSALSLSGSAEVAELVDALDLGSSGAIRGGSSPPFGILIVCKALDHDSHLRFESAAQWPNCGGGDGSSDRTVYAEA